MILTGIRSLEQNGDFDETTKQIVCFHNRHPNRVPNKGHMNRIPMLMTNIQNMIGMSYNIYVDDKNMRI